MIAPGAANPRTTTTFADETLPLAGSSISRPVAGICGPIVPTGTGVGLGLGLGVGLGLGLGEGVGVGLGLGDGVGVGLGEGDGVGVGVGLAVGVGLGDGVGVVGFDVGTAVTPAVKEGD